MARRAKLTEAEIQADDFESPTQYAQHVVQYWSLANEVEYRKMMRSSIHGAYEANRDDPSGVLDSLTVMADNDLFQACCEIGWDWENHWEEL